MVAVAWAYWMVHRLSFSGLGASGKFSEDKWRRWLENREGDLAEYPTLIKAWKITNRPFEEVIQQPWTGKHPFLFLDPPYDFRFDMIQHERIWRRIERTAAKAENRHPRQPRKENLYGDKGDLPRDFDHRLLKRMAERRAMPWDSTGPCVMITYNDKPSLREEYQRRWTGRRWHVFDASVEYSLRSNPDYRREQKDRSEIILTNYDPFA